MPATIETLNGLVWTKPYVKMKRSGGGGFDTAGGAIQRVSASVSLGWNEVRGPESLSPVGRGVNEEILTFEFQQAVFNAELYTTILGMNADYNAGTNKTRIWKRVNQEPATFDMKMQSPDGGADVEMIFYRCTVDQAEILSADQRTFAMNSATIRVNGQSTSEGEVLYEMLLPGNLTNSS